MLRASTYIVALLTAAIMLSACNAPNRPNSDSETSGELTSMGELNVPKSFDWKTFRDIEVKLTADERGLVRVVNSKGTVYHQAYLGPDTEYTFNLTVPNFENNVKMQFRGKEKPFELTTKRITHHFDASANTSGANNRSIARR